MAFIPIALLRLFFQSQETHDASAWTPNRFFFAIRMVVTSIGVTSIGVASIWVTSTGKTGGDQAQKAAHQATGVTSIGVTSIWVTSVG